jgi:hypothetical protein
MTHPMENLDGTRAAIKRFQTQSGFPESEFLTAQQRAQLIEGKWPVEKQAGRETSEEDRGPVESGTSAQVETQETGRSGAEISSRTVEVTGEGESLDAAHDDATRQAIMQVAGEYIDTKRLVVLKIDDERLSEMLSEKIISYSNGFVEKVEPISSENKAGLFYFRAKITIKTEPLVDKLAGMDISTKSVSPAPIDTLTIIQRLRAGARAGKGATALIQRLINEQLDFYEVKLAGEFKQVDEPKVSSLPGVWVKAPLKFRARQDTITEWQKTFAMIADASFEGSFHIETNFRQKGSLFVYDRFRPSKEADKRFYGTVRRL